MKHDAWEVFPAPWGAEVIPKDDLRAHRGGDACACKPFWDTKTVLVHNAWDKREESQPDYKGPARGARSN